MSKVWDSLPEEAKIAIAMLRNENKKLSQENTALQSEVKRLQEEVERLKTANGTDENGRPIHYDITG